MKSASVARRIAVVLMAGSLLAAACGGDDDETGSTAAESVAGSVAESVAESLAGSSPTAATTSEPSTAATSGSAPTPSAGPASTGAAGEPAGDVCTPDRVGGEVTMATLAEPAGLDPVVNRGTGYTGGNEILALYDTLVRYEPETDEFVPMVAESLEPNDDFTQWTLTLREGVTFGNGDPLTAEAVQASFARHQVKENNSPNYLESQAVTEMEVVDPLTLVFHLDAPWSRFPSLLAHNAGMVVNPAVVEAQGENFTTNPVGGGVGPYELERWVPGEELVLTAKTDWWGGPVCIEQVRFVMVPGAEATYDAFKNGDVQLAFLRAAGVIAEARADGVEGLLTITGSGRGLILNHVNGPTADLTVRQALAAAIDPEVINERAFDGAGLVTTAIIAAESVHYDGLEGPQPDPARAADLVEQAKAAGWDGNLELLCQPDPDNQAVCLAVKAMLDAAGMNLTITTLQVNDLIPKVLQERSYQMAAWSFPLSDAEPWLRLSASVATGGSFNPGGYTNPEMDAALDQLRQAPDEDARKAALAEIQRIFTETTPNIIFESSQAFIALDDSIKSMLPSQNAQVHFDQAYIEA